MYLSNIIITPIITFKMLLKRSKKLQLNDWTAQSTENLVKLVKHNDEAL